MKRQILAFHSLSSSTISEWQRFDATETRQVTVLAHTPDRLGMTARGGGRRLDPPRLSKTLLSPRVAEAIAVASPLLSRRCFAPPQPLLSGAPLSSSLNKTLLSRRVAEAIVVAQQDPPQPLLCGGPLSSSLNKTLLAPQPSHISAARPSSSSSSLNGQYSTLLLRGLTGSIHRRGHNNNDFNTGMRNKPAARGGPRSVMH
jgi:hypothetical protein